ncbi:MAG TPA: flagellar motor switch protein FliM [Vicinamibacterales bacterium]|jgi:flagellar motor switch protein FliM|nr:flagellar motor switch protein FliM [Vicinamibacterales bacterium]
MAKILSQAEIDALLTVAADAPIGRRANAQGPVVRYNFRRPDRVSKEQIHALQFLHERCARNMSTSLSAYLRTTINMTVASVEQFAYSEFLGSLTDPTAFYALSIAPFDELGAVEINPSVAFAMLDRMLGGSGQPAPVNRPLTEIEQNVVDAVLKLVLEGLSEAWRPVTSLTFGIRARETRPQMLQVAAPNEIVVAVVFDVQIGAVRGLVNLCIPTSVVEVAGTHFAHAWQRQRRELSAQERAWMDENLASVTVPVVPLIRTELHAGAVLALQPGEVVALPLAADRPLDVYAGGVRKFTGRLASDRGRLMVMVEERCGAPHAAMNGAQ